MRNKLQKYVNIGIEDISDIIGNINQVLKICFQDNLKVFERYDRNILINEIGNEGQKTLLSSNILVAGAGGLGSTVLANLASIGIGTIGIIDNDTLELSNLNRQFIHKLKNIGKPKTDSAKEWIKNFNPDINIETYQLKLDKENYKNIIEKYDLIIDCFDSYESKFLLNKIAVEHNKIFIHGGVSEFCGQVITIIGGKTACLGCIMPDIDVNTYFTKGVISPVVSIIASIQSMESVKMILNIGKPLTNRLLTYDGLNMKFKELNIGQNPNCLNECSRIHKKSAGN